MFGYQNNQAKNTKVVPDETIHVGADTGPGDAPQPPEAPEPATATAAPEINSNPEPASSGPLELIDSPSNSGPAPISDIVHTGKTPSGPASAPPMPLPPTDTPSDDLLAGDSSTHELIDIKQQALGALSPLVDHLDQAPTDKFRTTMMMIQASDDHTLIKTAYEAAKQIEDEKVRAQALLDIVNEINYFTQHQQS